MADTGRTADGTPSLSLAERDRRYALIRNELSERNIDAVIVGGSHLLYLSNGLPGEMVGILPREETESFTAILPWRFLVDIPKQVLLDAQDWVTDLRSGRAPPPPVIERLKELRVEAGTVGYAGPFSHQLHSALVRAMPGLVLVDASDILNNVRTIKSDEEIALIDRANHIFNAAIARIHAEARPGMLGREVVQIGLNAMWDAGGDIDSAFSFNFGDTPAQNPVLAEICLDRTIHEGDVGTLTAHSHYRHYAGHSDQEIVFGEPKERHVEMFEAVKSVRSQVLERVRAGVTHKDLVETYNSASSETGFETSEHSQMHQYGLDVPEFPGIAYRLKDGKGMRGLGGAGNFRLETGMIYSISPTLIDGPTGDLLLGGTSLAVTENGYRELGAREVELLVAG